MSASHQGARTAAVVVPLVLLLIGAAAYGAHLALREPPAATASGVSGSNSEIDSGSGSGSDSGSAASAPSASCWDGTTAATTADCSPLAGTAALAWVFASFDPDDPACRDRTREPPRLARVLRWECLDEVAGAEVYLTYSQFAGIDRGMRDLDEEYASGERSEQTGSEGEVSLVVWDLEIDEHHSRTLMYADAPFAVTVWAVNEEQADQALAELVRMRGADRVANQPVARAG